MNAVGSQAVGILLHRPVGAAVASVAVEAIEPAPSTLGGASTAQAGAYFKKYTRSAASTPTPAAAATSRLMRPRA